jgi:hypothetical protein
VLSILVLLNKVIHEFNINRFTGCYYYKGKVVPVLFSIEYGAMKANRGSRGMAVLIF